jgi:catechol 2,3-dioxygenase-like lactoylglutathione lyase family enzyme
MLQRFVYAAVFVKDQDKALDFYTNVLGFVKGVEAPNPTPGAPRFLTVALDGQDFQLVLWPGTPGKALPSPQGHIPGTYTMETSDCRQTYDELKSRGVKFETDVLEFPWGSVAVFQDPDGNRLQIRELRKAG